MRALKIESGGKIFIDGEYADLSKLSNKGEFIMSILSLDIEFGENVSCADLVHLFYDAKDLIKGVLSEEYEVVRALVHASNLPRDYKSIRIYKSFKIEKEEDEEFIYMIPEIELIPSIPGENGVRNISGLSVYIDEEIILKNDNININSKTKITLFNLLTCLFEELPYLIKSGSILLNK